ncbi:MAG: WbqC family protein, partial [Draconibacterium sp.]
MKVAIHQPNFMPWLGYFYKMAKADVFVLLDDVRHSKSSFTNRVQIKTPQGPKLLSVPLAEKEILINQLPISNDGKWNKNQLKLIHNSYRKAPCFNLFYDKVATIFSANYPLLIDLNIE